MNQWDADNVRTSGINICAFIWGHRLKRNCRYGVWRPAFILTAGLLTAAIICWYIYSFQKCPLAIMCLDNYDEVLWSLLIQQQCGAEQIFHFVASPSCFYGHHSLVWPHRSCPCSCSGHWTLGASHTTNRARGHYCQLLAVWGRKPRNNTHLLMDNRCKGPHAS